MSQENSNSQPENISPNITKEELGAILEAEEFEYQKIALPHGLYTKGEDRSATAKLILPENMENSTVLEIGCCYGYFLYEARRRGATKTMGLEINPKRLRQAKLIRKILGEDIQLSDDDFYQVCQNENFDYILMLNLIHHLVDPIAAIRVAAKCTNRRLIIEFPTPLDKRFKKLMLPGVAQLLNSLPVIAVGPMSATGQTYLFTKRAMQRALIDHEKLFGSIDFLPSPKKGRLIAICKK